MPQLVGIVLVSFLLVKTIPGDPGVADAGADRHAGGHRQPARQQLGLDKPLPVQFLIYLKPMAASAISARRGRRRGRSPKICCMRFPATLELVTFGLLLAILIGIPLGVAAALNPRRRLARTVSPISTA